MSINCIGNLPQSLTQELLLGKLLVGGLGVVWPSLVQSDVSTPRSKQSHGKSFMRWSYCHFNNLHFKSSLEANNVLYFPSMIRHVEVHSQLIPSVFLKCRLLKWQWNRLMNHSTSINIPLETYAVQNSQGDFQNSRVHPVPQIRICQSRIWGAQFGMENKSFDNIYKV